MAGLRVTPIARRWLGRLRLHCETNECPCELFDDADLSELPAAEAAFVVEQAMIETQCRWTEADGDAFVCRVLACDENRLASSLRPATCDSS